MVAWNTLLDQSPYVHHPFIIIGVRCIHPPFSYDNFGEPPRSNSRLFRTPHPKGTPMMPFRTRIIVKGPNYQFLNVIYLPEI